MSHAKKAPAPVVVSAQIRSYALNKTQLALFGKFDKLVKYMEEVGKTPPCIRLSKRDYLDVDRRVREQSEGAMDLSKVRYGSFPILSTAE